MNAETKTQSLWQSNAEFYLCMAHLFIGLQTGRIDAGKIRTELLPDLQDLSIYLPSLTSAMLEQLQQQLQDETNLLIDFSRLFLVPPAPAPLNLGYYLDGGLMGRTTKALETFYEHQSLVKNSVFHDLSDHLALTLEWLAWTMANAQEYQNSDSQRSQQAMQDLGSALHHYLLPGTEHLLQQVHQATDAKQLGRFWLLLLQLIHHQMMADLQQLQTLLPESPLQDSLTVSPASTLDKTHPTDELPPGNPDESLSCSRCGVEFAAGEMLSTMILRLREAGLTTDHVETCPACRDIGVQELQRVEPPAARPHHKR